MHDHAGPWLIWPFRSLAPWSNGGSPPSSIVVNGWACVGYGDKGAGGNTGRSCF